MNFGVKLRNYSLWIMKVIMGMEHTFRLTQIPCTKYFKTRHISNFVDTYLHILPSSGIGTTTCLCQNRVHVRARARARAKQKSKGKTSWCSRWQSVCNLEATNWAIKNNVWRIKLEAAGSRSWAASAAVSYLVYFSTALLRSAFQSTAVCLGFRFLSLKAEAEAQTNRALVR